METISINAPNVSVKRLAVLADSLRNTRKELGVLDNMLLTLRLNLGSLRSALEAAFAPLAALVLPVVNDAIARLTDFCQDAGAVIAALFGTVYKKAVTTTRKTGSAVRRTLASFDQLNRLQGGGSGSGTAQSQTTLEPINDPLTPQLQGIVLRVQDCVARIQALVAPLRAMDFTPAMAAFARLGESVAAFGKTLGDSLSWAWFNLLTPLAAWTVEEAVPASVDLFRSSLELLTAALSPLMAGIGGILPALQPAASFLSETFSAILGSLRGRFETLAQLFGQKAPQIQGILENLGQCFSALWDRAAPAVENLRSFFLGVFQRISDAAAAWLGHMTDAFHGLTEFLAGVLTGDWSRAWEGLKSILKGAVNGIISLLNSLLSGMAAGLNNITAALNKWHVEIPGWVPLMGGKTFGFHLKAISAPQIPYLARGAVLPANKPFLAVVGDQRHGTNIEAPLSTIQEAVALALEDFISGNMAGHEATVSVLRELLAAVRGIHIGDDDVAAAVRRSQIRRTVMKGGGYAL